MAAKGVAGIKQSIGYELVCMTELLRITHLPLADLVGILHHILLQFFLSFDDDDPA